MKLAQDMIATVSAMDVVHMAAPSTSEHAVNRRNKPTGRRLSGANRSATHPQKKYPNAQPRGGISNRVRKSACETPSPWLRYKASIVRIGPGAIAGKE